MKLRKDFVIKEHKGKQYAIATGEATKYFKGMLELNELGVFIFKMLKDDTSESLIADAVTEEYDVDRTEALADINAFIRQLRLADILED